MKGCMNLILVIKSEKKPQAHTGGFGNESVEFSPLGVTAASSHAF